MFKKSFALLLILVLVVTAFTGCGSKKSEPNEQQNQAEKPAPAEGKEMVLNWNLGSEPKTLDPQLNSASDGGHVINNTFEGLMREVNGKLEPAIAESYEVSEDELTYTFHLRDTKWSDGKPLTAHDFEFAWKRALDPKLASEYAFQLFYIKGGQEYYEGKGTRDDVAVKALDDKTLQVTLNAPTPYFLDLTTFYTYMPTREDIVDNEGIWAKDPSKFICNGPFKLVEYKSGDKLVLAKNENYWRADEVKIDKIIASMIVDQSTALTAYESGELDVIDNMPTQEIPRLQAEDPTFTILPQIGTYYYIFNVNKEPVNDVRVRRALTLAIDRKAIVETVTKAAQVPATGFVPVNLTLSTGEEFRKVAGDYGIDPNGANVEEAKKLLAEAGYPDGKGFPEITILYNTSEGHKAIAEAIQEMWKKNLGINVKLANQEWAVFQDTRHQGNFTVARAGWLADYADPMTFLDLWTTYSGNNDAQWKVKAYDKLIEKAKLVSGKERDKLLLEAEKMIMDEMIVMPIYYYTDPVMVKEKVKDWQKTKLGHWYFGYAYIAE
ncbi:oligopeptide transport system substrate-binding protein [Caminicella sporogenes DSM 14501]|uniref:Oligopeptide transport system substrate-binding protein n=1 Tax=Caminicella sporogenes DSM 14501 TaxID=1121266 RepID=A0A1M6SZN0_9FIRM|nr:peptide ABC transporter substrate-binding protein [Caminicella sporogenes]RKD26389.1 peptide ABC transporter substrate-binding protein [Caminicella sporogenes]SHK50151.1 oligopeptide transport system substrate-binding protein [Caminicella sporogenes DSM 14501]